MGYISNTPWLLPKIIFHLLQDGCRVERINGSGYLVVSTSTRGKAQLRIIRSLFGSHAGWAQAPMGRGIPHCFSHPTEKNCARGTIEAYNHAEVDRICGI